MSRHKRVKQDACDDGMREKGGLLDRISGIRAMDARKLMGGDGYRAAKEREADECRRCAKAFLQKDAVMASEMLERAADVYRILGEMQPDQFRQKECCLAASRLYDEAGWLVAGADAARAAQLIVKSGEALAFMEGKCGLCLEAWGIKSWKNAARVKYSNALRLLEGRAERLSKSTSIDDTRKGVAYAQEAKELRKRCFGDEGCREAEPEMAVG